MSISLLNGLHLAFRGIQTTEQHIKVAAQNISNADREGYTRKSFQADYITGNFGTVPLGGTVYSAMNEYLLEGVVDDISDLGKKNVIAEYLDVYVRRTGNIVSDFSLTSTLNDFFSNLDLLAITPENRAQKGQIISDAEVIALYLRDQSGAIQDQRTGVELEIDKTIDRINENLQIIKDLNDKVVTTTSKNATTLVEYEDQRAMAVQALAEDIDITYFKDSMDRMQIYAPTGQPLLTHTVSELSFDPVATLAGSVTYSASGPSGINGIFVNGVDITGDVNGGKLSGLIELRDGTLVEEQEKLDEFAAQLRDTLNAVLNTGASRPPRNELVGEAGFALTDPWAGSGTVRVAITDADGVVQSFTDLDLSQPTNMNDLINGSVVPPFPGLDGLAGISAQIDANGQVVITADDPDHGISINELDSDVGADNRGFSHFLGLNNMFTGNGAEDITVAQYLLDDSDVLALGQLDGSAGLAVGDIGITIGDTRVIQGISTALDASVAFSAAGDFSAQSVSLRVYAESVMSRAALKGSSADDAASSAEILYQQGADFMNNVSGVNVDEETAILLELESHYQASAQVIAVIKGLLEDLINAVR